MRNPANRLKNKRVVITGASSGLGRALATILAREGSKVAIGARKFGRLNSLREQITSAGGICISVPTDVSSRTETAKLISAAIRGWGGIDIIVNNASFAQQLTPVHSINESILNLTFKTNVYSVFYTLRRTLPYMMSQGQGFIINISSVAGRRAIKNMAAYSASKFAVRGITESMAQELSDTEIKCISISPGGMDTHMRSKLFGKANSRMQQSPEFVACVLRDILAGRIKVPNGADVVVRKGMVKVILPEKWK